MTALFYTRETAAEAASVSKDTIIRAINAGTLRAKRISKDEDGNGVGKYLISVEQLKDWFEGLADA